MYREDAFLVALVIGIVLAFLLGIVGLTRVGNELAVPGQLAAIEQLREDVKRVADSQSEDVIGQVTQWNQEIRSAKRYREIWWGRMFTPDEWESVEVITIPGEKP
jgi:hypothetical protein